MFTQYEVGVRDKSKPFTEKFRKWSPWSGQFLTDEHWTIRKVRAHILRHFKSKPYYNQFDFGLFGCALSQRIASDKTITTFNNWYFLETI